jgi:hypothetical protein
MSLTIRACTGSILFTISLAASANTEFEDERAARPMAARFIALAGSPENAMALVYALRNGDRVMLVQDDGGPRVPQTTVFELPTKRMQWDDVGICLALVEDSLVREGVRRPSAEQLEEALLRVLQSLADGLEWKDIPKVHARGKSG